MNKQEVLKGIKCGLTAGLVSTVATDLVSMAMFAIIGGSLWSFFDLIGRCFLTLLGTNVPDPAWLGLALHYSIGILPGLTIGLLTLKFSWLRFSSYRKGILTAIIITQMMGNTLFYLMSVIMSISLSEMALIYVSGFVLHLIWGTCLGLIITYGQRQAVTAAGVPIGSPAGVAGSINLPEIIANLHEEAVLY